MCAIFIYLKRPFIHVSKPLLQCKQAPFISQRRLYCTAKGACFYRKRGLLDMKDRRNWHPLPYPACRLRITATLEQDFSMSQLFTALSYICHMSEFFQMYGASGRTKGEVHFRHTSQCQFLPFIHRYSRSNTDVPTFCQLTGRSGKSIFSPSDSTVRLMGFSRCSAVPMSGPLM